MKKLLSCVSIAAFSAVTLLTVPPSNAAANPAPTPAQNYGYGRQAWDTPPPQLRGVERQGFMDGIRGARKDAENHRRFDVNNRDEYRHPHYRGREREAYRHGFREGYRVAVEHMTGRRYGR